MKGDCDELDYKVRGIQTLVISSTSYKQKESRVFVHKQFYIGSQPAHAQSSILFRRRAA